MVPVIVHLGSGVGDYFHYYNGNRGRERYFSNPNMDWYNKNCTVGKNVVFASARTRAFRSPGRRQIFSAGRNFGLQADFCLRS